MFDDIVRADYDFYKDVYRGSESEDIITDALEQAAMQVFTATFCRTKASKLSAFQTELVKMAICEQADNVSNKDMEVDMSEMAGVTGYTIGDVSISFDSSQVQTTVTSKNIICDKARNYLMPTGLLNRCLF